MPIKTLPLFRKFFFALTAFPVFGGDGSAFRYLTDKSTGDPYFAYADQIEVAGILEKYNAIPSTPDFVLGKIVGDFDFQDRRKIWDLTFHMGECQTLGQIRTQYDEVIEFLIEGILMNDYDLQKLYLPLLFLIRHSLELALKDYIYETQSLSDLIKDKDYTHEHSLARLFNCYDYFLSKVPLTQMSPVAKAQYEGYKPMYDQLHGIIHDLDVNSRYFRYPVDKNNSSYRFGLKPGQFIELLKLYYFVDPFITFTNIVLQEEGLL
jgi:hypothetical protein